MRDFILVYINGKRYEIDGNDAFVMLADFLRQRLRLTGTKIVCREGDCGSCTVLCGRIRSDDLQYQPIDSCIACMFQLDGCHIVTVEGFADREREGYSAVQESMVQCHGSQCGFCTPGFVVAMAGLLESSQSLSPAQWRTGLTGNLCRCTGYQPIVEAGCRVDLETHRSANQLYPPEHILEKLLEARASSFRVEHTSAGGRHLALGPTTIAEAAELRESYPHARLIAGGTDIGVQINKGSAPLGDFIDLNRIEALTKVEYRDESIYAGAGARWTKIQDACHSLVPEFSRLLRVFGSPQIRHAGTIGGNIVNASPIADSLPFLLISGAELELTDSQKTRIVNINDFYLGYKQVDLRPQELLTRVRIPLPAPDQVLRLYRVSRRRDMDIATFTAGISLEVHESVVRSAKIALGAVGPTVFRATKTEQFLAGEPFTETTMRAAGTIAEGETSPISDVRGSAEYRRQLTRNIFLKFYHEAQQSA